MGTLNVLIVGKTPQSLTDWLKPLNASPMCTTVVLVLDAKGAQQIIEKSYDANVVILTGAGSNESLEKQIDSIRKNNIGRIGQKILILLDASNPINPLTLRFPDVETAYNSVDIASFLKKHINGMERMEKNTKEVVAPIEKLASPKQNEYKRDLLTPRQTEVLRLVNLGNSNKQIARVLDLTEGTIKVHCKAIFRALGVVNRTQAAVLMAKANITHTEYSERS